MKQLHRFTQLISRKMNTQLLLENLRCVPDYPIKGIMFQDVSTLFKNPECIQEMKNELVRIYKDKGITKVVGLESRGFVMGAILADELGAGFVMARKPGKLPAETRRISYKKEYGEDSIEIHADAIEPGDVILIQDDLLATGGSMRAVCELCKEFQPAHIYVNFLIELDMEGLNGRKTLEGLDVTTLMTISA